MSFRSTLDRVVSIVPTVVDGQDRYGNDERTPGDPVPNVRARRDQTGAAEDVTDRDQQTRTFLYLLPLRSEDGTTLALSGRDRLVDGTDTYQVIGEPELVNRRRRPHHWEAAAERIDG